MNKLTKVGIVITTLIVSLVLSSGNVFAASAARQLAKGIELYNNNKPEQAMEYFIEVMVRGNTKQIAEANRYVNLIHAQVGGIQDPVEVDINYKEGEMRKLDTNLAAQEEIQTDDLIEEANANAMQAVQQVKDNVSTQEQQLLDDLNAQQAALAQQIQEKQLATQNAIQIAAAQNAAAQNAVANTAEQIQEDLSAIPAAVAADTTAVPADVNPVVADVPVAAAEEDLLESPVHQESVMTTSVGESASSTFTDLTTPEAVEARNLYTSQKLATMTQAAIDRIAANPKAHLYMRDGKPDAIDIDDGVLFDNKGNFRTESLPLLNDIYELLALTQGAAYIILPPGSYTDDVTLSGMRQAAALDSYLVKRGISQGKLSYNMGLVDEEPPARFANLNGLSIVFDYDAKLPTRMEKNENDETTPLLSMAIVPQCHAIDRSLGEAYAIDFSVLETVQGLDNWVLQVIQHGRDGKYYIVRQLEGFSPVYYQILWNGRKGIIGPELPCGKYTIALTATDTNGVKQTLRRRVVVKCNSQQSDYITDTCGVKKQEVKQTANGELNYKAARLWKKPARIMGGAKAAGEKKAEVTENATAASTSSASYTHTKTVRNIVTEDTSAPTTTSTTVSSSDAYYGDLPADADINPYSMPYEDLN